MIKFDESYSPEYASYINMLSDIHRLLQELREVRNSLYRSAALTDTAIQRIEAKLYPETCTTAFSSDWNTFMNSIYIQCMNSKNAKRYNEELAAKEVEIWLKLLEICGSNDLVKNNKIDEKD